MRVMIIGAGGFLGAHVWHRVSAAGAEVVTAGRSALAGSSRHQPVDLAEEDPARIAAMIAEVAPDAVLNCAGATTGDAGALVAANMTGTYALTRAMLLAKEPRRLVHLGSAAEYGRTEPGQPVRERTVPRPGGTYGATKLGGTRLVELAAAAGLDAVVLRVFNPVGPGAPPTSLPGRLAAELRRAQRDGTSVQLGSLDAVRDFVDVRDVADAVLAAAVAPALPHPVLNVGRGAGVPVRMLVTELLGISGCTAAVHEDTPGPARSADIPWQQADITLATQDLTWAPRRDLATSLTDMWEASS
jgi:nucleoside-diphosphate-sugar epimerase